MPPCRLARISSNLLDFVRCMYGDVHRLRLLPSKLSFSFPPMLRPLSNVTKSCSSVPVPARPPAYYRDKINASFIYRHYKIHVCFSVVGPPFTTALQRFMLSVALNLFRLGEMNNKFVEIEKHIYEKSGRMIHADLTIYTNTYKKKHAINV